MILVLNSKTLGIGIVIDIEIIGTGMGTSIVGIVILLLYYVVVLVEDVT